MTFGATLTGAEVTAVASSNKAGIYGTTTGTAKFHRFQVDCVTALASPRLTFYNGSRAGTGLIYQAGPAGRAAP